MNTPSENGGEEVRLPLKIITDLSELESLSPKDAKKILVGWIENDTNVENFFLTQVISPAQIMVELCRRAGMDSDPGPVSFDECQTFMYYFCLDKKRSLEIAMHIAHNMKS